MVDLGCTACVQIRNDGLPPGIDLVTAGAENGDLSDWFLDIRVLDQNPLYTDETYRLKFRFPKSYPIGTLSQSNPYAVHIHD